MLLRFVRALRVLVPLESSSKIPLRCHCRMESTTSSAKSDEILVEKRGSLVISTLNRPRALNALNTSMIIQLMKYLKEWDDGIDVGAAIVQGAGGKAFCAGGDVKAVVQSETVEERIDFFRHEYNMNYAISKFQKPMICLMDGIVMGGGCGVAMHAPFRVATERTVCAMPECAIGFVPDVGSSYFLNRLPDTIGMFMALTGKRIKGLELKAVGLATHYVASEQMPTVLEHLINMGTTVRDHSAVDTVLKKLEVQDHLKEMSSLYERLSLMGSMFNPFESSFGDLLAKLASSDIDDSTEALESINSGAPLSVSLAHELLKRMAGQSLKMCLQTEMTLAANLSRGQGEFFEGVRALLIDKDKMPKWKYHRSQITPELIDQFFQPKEGDPPLFGPTAKL